MQAYDAKQLTPEEAQRLLDSLDEERKNARKRQVDALLHGHEAGLDGKSLSYDTEAIRIQMRTRNVLGQFRDD